MTGWHPEDARTHWRMLVALDDHLVCIITADMGEISVGSVGCQHCQCFVLLGESFVSLSPINL